MTKLVEVAIEAGVATLWLSRPEKRNALDRSLMEALGAAIAEIRDDANVRAVLLRGRGPIFSSGIDHALLLEVFQRAQTAPFAHLHHDLQDVFHRLERMHKPTIAAIHGVAVGMACELALACDFRVATANAALGLPEIAFGILPDVGGTTRIVRTVGPVRARELVLTGRLVSGRDAAAMGLVNEIVADEAELDARATALARLLASHPPAAVGHAKQLLLESADVDSRTSFALEGTVQQILIRSPGVAEGFARGVQWIKDEVKRVQQAG